MFELQSPPDYFGQFMAPLQKQQALNIEQQQVDAQQQAYQAKAQEEYRKAQQAAMFQQDAASVIADPTPEGYRRLLLKYPEMHEGLKASWDQYSEGQKERDTNAAGQVYAALQNGRSDLALQLLKDRKTALANGGEDDKITDQLIEMVESNDPAKIKQAQGIAGFVLAQATGPDKIGSTLESLSKYGATGDKGQVVGRAIGHYENGEFKVDYRDPDAPQYRELDVMGPDGQTHKAIVAVGGGQGASPTGAKGGFDQAVSTVLANEGGYNPSDMNGAPVNFGINQKANPGIKVKDLTRDQAKQIYHDKYWVPSGAESLPANLQTPYFDVYIRNPKFAKKALADSGGDPVKFATISSTYFQNLAKKPNGQKYAQAWAARDANNMAIASGGAVSEPNVVAMGAPGGSSAEYRVLSDDDAAKRGLPSGIKYQLNASNGQITALGGQNRQAKQIPQQVQTKVQPVVDVRDTLARLKSTWADDFGGHTVLGGGLNSIQGVIDVGPKGMRDWWADFQSMDNVVRNQLFGSALTEHEKQAYAATTITPRMAQDQIKKNLARRFSIISAAAARQQNFLKKNGYDADAVDALFQPLGDFGASVGPSSSNAPVKVRSVQEAMKLAPGTLFVTPDGRTLRKK